MKCSLGPWILSRFRWHVDRTPPTLTVTADPSVLLPVESWVPVQVDVQAQDETDPDVRVVLVDIAPSWEVDRSAVDLWCRVRRGRHHVHAPGHAWCPGTLLHTDVRRVGRLWKYCVRLHVVDVGNHQPLAQAGPDQTAGEGNIVCFDGSASTDADGDALTYSWDFGDGATATGPMPSHVFADDGIYTVTLTVDDQYYGGQHNDTLTVTVHNAAPTIGSLIGPGSGVRGQTLSYSCSFQDLGEEDTHTMSWRVFRDSHIVGTGSGVEFDFTPTSNGDYVVTCTVTDDDGGEDTASQSVAVHVMDVQPEPDDPTTAALVVGGTTGKDHIVVTPWLQSGRYIVWISTGCFAQDRRAAGGNHVRSDRDLRTGGRRHYHDDVRRHPHLALRGRGKRPPPGRIRWRGVGGR